MSDETEQVEKRLKEEFCPYCKNFKDKGCFFFNICLMSLHRLKKDKPLYFELF